MFLVLIVVFDFVTLLICAALISCLGLVFMFAICLVLILRLLLDYWLWALFCGGDF